MRAVHKPQHSQNTLADVDREELKLESRYGRDQHRDLVGLSKITHPQEILNAEANAFTLLIHPAKFRTFVRDAFL